MAFHTRKAGSSLKSTTHQGFAAHEHLDSVTLIDMNGRVYDPWLGQFLSADPVDGNVYLSQRLARYSYVMNSPHGYTDPSGFDPMARMMNYADWFYMERDHNAAISDLELAKQAVSSSLQALRAAGSTNDSAYYDAVSVVVAASSAVISSSYNTQRAMTSGVLSAELAAIEREQQQLNAFLDRNKFPGSASTTWDPVDAALEGIAVGRDGRGVPVFDVGLVDFAGGSFMPDIGRYNPRTGTFGNGQSAMAAGPLIPMAFGAAVGGLSQGGTTLVMRWGDIRSDPRGVLKDVGINFVGGALMGGVTILGVGAAGPGSLVYRIGTGAGLDAITVGTILDN